MSNCCSCSTPAQTPNVHTFDARGVARRFRHAAIFGALETLTPGETMRFHNDHDPQPLLAQLRGYFGPRIGINYLTGEPDEVVIDFTINS